MCHKEDHSSEIIRSEFLEHMTKHQDCVHIYTDGSKSNAGVGFGIIFEDFKRYGALPYCASIFTAELYAILTALKQIISFNSNNFVLFCDSQSVLQSLQAFNPVHPLVIDILEWIVLA